MSTQMGFKNLLLAIHKALKNNLTLITIFFFIITIKAQLKPVIVGDASDLGDNCYQITPDTRQQAGAVWYDNPIDLSTDFEIQFRANFGDKDRTGADGTAFVLKGNPNSEIGTPGKGIGYGGITPSVIVEFDTFQNGIFQQDPFQDHIGIYKNGSDTNNNTLARAVQASGTNANIEDGEFHNIKIEWVTATNTLSVSFDCQERINASSDIIADIFSGNPIVYFGFTGSTGNSTNEHVICYDNISFTSFLEDKTLCKGASITEIDATTVGASGYKWTPQIGVSDPNSPNPVFTPTKTTTYTVEITNICGEVFTDSFIANITDGSNPGTNSTFAICNTGADVDLFDKLGGTPDAGGTWAPALSSGTGVFNPNIDPAGTYTYTVNGTGTCSGGSADVTVSITNSPDAGTNANIALCNSDAAINLFDELGGTPNTGGEWTPALNSGSGIFDPATDTAGTYTYTIDLSGCTIATSQVIVSINNTANAGEDATLSVCTTGASVDLFDKLGGTPDTRGNWTPALNSGTGVFDPNIDTAGTYIYTVNGVGTCSDDTANVVVTISTKTNAGEDATLAICSTGATVNLFDNLGGTPDTGGTWAPALNSGTGVFDPNLDPAGTYTYTVNGAGTCSDDTANVVVSITNSPDAGINASIDLCNNDVAINLFDKLGGTPNTGGVWTPALNSGSGIFDPATDTAGTYTYTIDLSGCTIATSQVIVTINDAPNAGEDGDISICKTDSTIDLFTLLNNTPDTGGVWTPTLTSGTGVFDPNIDPSGTYTYTINGVGACATDTANVSVTLNGNLIVLKPDNLKSCDANNDTFETFDLEQQTTFITADNLDYTVTYHLSKSDADAAINPLTSPYTNISNPQTIYTRVINSNTGCFDTSINFDIELGGGVIANDDTYETCDNNVELDGDTTNDTNTFDLESRNPIILGQTQTPANFNVSYYLTQNEASNATNPLNGTFTNTTNPQTIFARVDDANNDCFAISEVLLKVNPLPAFALNENYTICSNSDSTNIDTGLSTIDYSFEWFLNDVSIAGQTNGNITPVQTGNYSVNVTDKTTNCSTTANTTVTQSVTPILTAKQTSITFAEGNTILATATNSNTTINTAFEFSLDGGPFVSNTPNDGTYTFENVSAGQHTIIARDVNGCGETQVTIFIIDFNPYFTPNGDGFHDTWNIIGLENQPDAVIYIFDRYGKLLKQISPKGNGWNGIFNGERLPSNDYWFSVDYRDPINNENKQFKGHFALKR